MTNIVLFEEYVARIMAALYGSFPVRTDPVPGRRGDEPVVVSGISARRVRLLTIHRAKKRDVAASVRKRRVIRDSREE